MTTTSNSTNCVIYNMCVAAAKSLQNHTPNQPTLQSFYSKLSPDQLSNYYSQSATAMARLTSTTQSQWVTYYNTYMPSIITAIKNNQTSQAYTNAMNMLTVIGT